MTREEDHSPALRSDRDLYSGACAADGIDRQRELDLLLDSLLASLARQVSASYIERLGGLE